VRKTGLQQRPVGAIIAIAPAVHPLPEAGKTGRGSTQALLTETREETPMEKVAIEIPDELVQEFKPYQDRLREVILLGLSQLRIQEALLLYKRGLISFGRAAELAGLSRQEMIRQARAFGVQPRWSEQMVQEELA
jgi:predicted HTH domain antitoxin